MNKTNARDILKVIEDKLKQVTKEVFDENQNCQDLEDEICQRVNAKMQNLTRSLNFKLVIPNTIEIKKSTYKPATVSDGVLRGKIILEHCQKRDTFKYGGPGYPGRENGQLCVYPKNSRNFFKWNSNTGKWHNVYDGLRNKPQEMGLIDKLLNNAAFDSWWGDNPAMDGIKSDRKRNGSDNLWGNPDVRKFGNFKQITANVMQSIYNFTYDFRKALKFYEKIADALGYEDDEIIKNQDPNRAEDQNTRKDTIPHRIDAKYIDIKTGKHYNGFSSKVMGYEKAKKDSLYHVNRSDASVRVEVSITKQY